MVKLGLSSQGCPTAWGLQDNLTCQLLVQSSFLLNHPDSWGERLLVIRSLLHFKRHVIMSFRVERTKLLQLNSAKVHLLMPPNWWQPRWENLHLNCHEKRLEIYPHMGLRDMLEGSLPSMFSRILEFQNLGTGEALAVRGSILSPEQGSSWRHLQKVRRTCWNTFPRSCCTLQNLPLTCNCYSRVHIPVLWTHIEICFLFHIFYSLSQPYLFYTCFVSARLNGRRIV